MEKGRESLGEVDALKLCDEFQFAANNQVNEKVLEKAAALRGKLGIVLENRTDDPEYLPTVKAMEAFVGEYAPKFRSYNPEVEEDFAKLDHYATEIFRFFTYLGDKEAKELSEDLLHAAIKINEEIKSILGNSNVARDYSYDGVLLQRRNGAGFAPLVSGANLLRRVLEAAPKNFDFGHGSYMEIEDTVRAIAATNLSRAEAIRKMVSKTGGARIV